MVPEAAAFDPEAPWIAHLERAHRMAHQVAQSIAEETLPSHHLAPAARHLESGLRAMYDAFDGRTDRPTAIGIAHAKLWDAAILVARGGLPLSLATLRAACSELIAAEERYPRVTLTSSNSGTLRASSDVLPLHAVARPSLGPSLRAPAIPVEAPVEPAPELPEPTTFEELAAVAKAARLRGAQRAKALTQRRAAPKLERKREVPEVPPGFAFAPPPRTDDDALVRRWARECFDEIGMLAIQRAPLPGDSWRDCQGLERRLVAVIDAVAALGPAAIAHIEAYAMDAPAADSMRIFAAALLGGCLEGRDALACAERVLHRFGPSDPLVSEPFVAAMKLAPNPFVPNAMRALLVSDDPACQVIAVEVLAYRGELTPTELEALSETENAKILALVLPLLGATRHPDAARAIERGLAHADLTVQEAALDAMALSARKDVAAAARAAAEGALGDQALIRLAVVARDEDARWLMERMKKRPSVKVIEAMGWLGLVDAVEPLIRALESGEEAEKRAAGAALDRLLGANLVEGIEVLPEALEDVEVVDPTAEVERKEQKPRPLAELVSDPRDVPSAGSKETLEVPSTDPAAWRAYWVENRERLAKMGRVRRGQPYAASIVLYELDQLVLSMEERRMLHRELAVRTGRVTRFDPHDLVAVQDGYLRAWAGLLGGAR